MRMNSNIDGIGEQLLFQLFGKKAFTLQFVEAQVQYAVALSLNDLKFGGNTDLGKAVPHKISLPEREVAASGAYDKCSIQGVCFADANLGFCADDFRNTYQS